MHDEKSRGWDEKYQAGTIPWDRGEASPALQHWLDSGELTPCRILIPGCGRGHEAVVLARSGFAVTAMDFAPSAIDHLRTELAKAGATAELVVADALHWQPDTAFDAIYEQTCLCALPPESWGTYERQLRHWLKPGGRLFALFMQTGREGGPPFHCDMANMRTLFPARHWFWHGEVHREVPHPNGLFEFAAILEKRSSERR